MRPLPTIARCVVLILLGLTFLPSSGATQEPSDCATALQDYRVALQSYQDGLLDPAIAGFEVYLQKCPEAEQALQVHYLLGEIFYKRQRYTEALHHATQVIVSQVHTASRPRALLLAAECARQLGRLEQAESYLQQIATSDQAASVLPAALYWLGELAFRQQRYEAAVAYYQRAINEQPSGTYAAYAQYALGWLYRQRGNAAAALEAFSALLALAPDHEFALQSRFARAALWRETGRLSEAMQAFKQLAQEAPGELREEALFWWAEMAYALGQYAEASTVYQRLLSEYSQSSRANASLYGWGWAEARRQHCADAVQPWETLLQRTPTSPQALEVHYQLGVCYIQLAQSDRARSHLRQVVEAQTRTAQRRDAYLKLAALAFQAKEYPEAIRYYTSALAEADPKEKLQLYYLLGESYAALGNSTQAIKHWQQVLAGPPTQPLRAQALFRIGGAYMAQHAWPMAISNLRQLWDDFPEFTERTAVAAYLVHAYGQLQRCTEALPFYDRLIDATEEPQQRQRSVGAKALCLFEARQYAEVIALLTPLLPPGPEPSVEPQLLYILGQAYLRLQQDQEALMPLTRLHQHFPDHPLTEQAEPLLARVLEQAGRSKEALTVWTAYLQRGVIQEEEELAKLRLHVGRLSLKQGQLEQVLDFLAPVREAASPTLAAEALFWSGEVYLRQQQWDVALQVYQELLDRYKAQQHWSALARLRLGMIYEHQQDWERALHTYQTLLTATTDEEVRANARQRIAAIESGRVLTPIQSPPPPKG